MSVQERTPIPTGADQEAAKSEIQGLFKAEYQKRDAESRRALAGMFLEEARKNDHDAALRFMFLNEANDLASRGGDIFTARSALKALEQDFDYSIDEDKRRLLEMTLDTLKVTSRSAKDSTSQYRIAAEYLDVSLDGLGLGDMATAQAAIRAGSSLARKLKDKALGAQFSVLSKDLPTLKQEYASVSKTDLEGAKDLADTSNNLNVGRFLCFVRGDWEDGLPFLLVTGMPDVEKTARLDLTAIKGGEGALEAAEAWLALANKERAALHMRRYRARALHWYEIALRGAESIQRLKIEQRLEELDESEDFDRLFLDLNEAGGIELVYIRRGRFTMGGTRAPTRGHEVDERPAHQVTITKGFFLGKYEVTRRQFAAFVKATGHVTDGEKTGSSAGPRPNGEWSGGISGSNWKTPATAKQTDDHPAVCISWNDATAFCEWASKKSGRNVRLPTEAEWEYACRAGTTTDWVGGNQESVLGAFAWFNKNSSLTTHPVGEKRPNAWGLYDMHGNASEWCSDWAGPYGGDATDPVGPSSGTVRINRGGSWVGPVWETRSPNRLKIPPSLSSALFGFRVVVR